MFEGQSCSLFGSFTMDELVNWVKLGSPHGLRNEIHNKQYSMNGHHRPFHHASSGCLQQLSRGGHANEVFTCQGQGKPPVHGKVHLLARSRGKASSKRAPGQSHHASMRPVVLPPFSSREHGLDHEGRHAACDERRFVSRRGPPGATGAGVQDRKSRSSR